MIKNNLESIGGVAAYGIISLCLFFAVFMGSMLFAFLHRAGFCKRMSALPLQNEKGDNNDE